MRIISQNGRIDLPYEQIVVENNTVDKITIIAYAVDSYDDTIWNLAEYSTKEKAEEVMKMLREGYRNYQTTRSRDGYYFAFDYPKVFRFPPDSEV